MKKLQTIILLICILTSCGQPEQEYRKRLLDQIDSLQNEIKVLKEKNKKHKSDKLESHSYNEDFDDFLYKFMTDSLYQIERTDFPLTFIHWKDNYPGSEIDTTNLNKDNWEHLWLYMVGFGEVPQIYDNYKMELRPTDRRLLHFTGVETGTNAKYFFEAKKSRWYLVKIINLGD